jgi:sarcosine oxidase
MDAEVAVIGTGTMGAMTLWNLARSGITAIGFEQYTLGHDRSAAGGESRMFRLAYKEGPQYVPMLLRARELWRELEAETGRDLLTVTGGLMIGDAGSGEIRNVIDSAERFALAHEVLDAGAMAARYPQHQPLLPGEIAVLDRMAGVVRPEFAVVSAARRAQTSAPPSTNAPRSSRSNPTKAESPCTPGAGTTGSTRPSWPQDHGPPGSRPAWPGISPRAG